MKRYLIWVIGILLMAGTVGAEDAWQDCGYWDKSHCVFCGVSVQKWVKTSCWRGMIYGSSQGLVILPHFPFDDFELRKDLEYSISKPLCSECFKRISDRVKEAMDMHFNDLTYKLTLEEKEYLDDRMKELTEKSDRLKKIKILDLEIQLKKEKGEPYQDLEQELKILKYGKDWQTGITISPTGVSPYYIKGD